MYDFIRPKDAGEMANSAIPDQKAFQEPLIPISSFYIDLSF